ncbi:MAG: hypothetical protein AAGD25_39750 [Cyanobacteria bacterium P01_F01_bin.150]
MHDNKVRLSKDVLEKAQAIADEWGLKNPRAAVEAVFRRYSDDYLYGRTHSPMTVVDPSTVMAMPTSHSVPSSSTCEALDALDDLLAM